LGFQIKRIVYHVIYSLFDTFKKKEMRVFEVKKSTAKLHISKIKKLLTLKKAIKSEYAKPIYFFY